MENRADGIRRDMLVACSAKTPDNPIRSGMKRYPEALGLSFLKSSFLRKS
jgi:hypothetical protein